jgi:DNA-binding transcriptional LysR family regulator
MNFLTLDLNLLRVFDVVMSEQNLTRAADRLATTQPAVSNALARLRGALDDELVVRVAHGVKPTRRAEEVWPVVRNALLLLETALEPGNLPVAEAKGVYRLMMADSAAAYFLPRLVLALQREAPGLDVRVLPLTTRDPRPMLLHHEIDIAIGSFPGIAGQLVAGQDGSSPIRQRRLYRSEYVCIMRKCHPLAEAPLTLDRYCGASHVLMSVSGRAQGLADTALSRLGKTRRIVLTVNQFSTVGYIVAQTNLISIVPRHLIGSISAPGTLVTKELPFELPQVHVDMLWHEREHRSRLHEWLRDMLGATPTALVRDTSI